MALKTQKQWKQLYSSPARKAVLPVIQQAADTVARETGVPSDVLRTALDVIAAKESDYNPKRMNKESGASGLFQYIPTTANALGINPFDITQASLAAARDAAKAFQRGGIAEVFKSHFAGPGGSGRGEKTREYALDALNGMNAFGLPAFAPAVRRGSLSRRGAPSIPAPTSGDEPQMAEDVTSDPLDGYTPPETPADPVLAALSKYPAAELPLPAVKGIEMKPSSPLDNYASKQRDPRTLAYFERLITDAPEPEDG